MSADLVSLCPSYGQHFSDSDTECNACEVKEDCMEKSKEFEASKKRRKNTTVFGHVTTAASGRIDQLASTGNYSVEEIAAELNCDRKRVMHHLRHLEKNCRVSVIQNEHGKVVATKITCERKPAGGQSESS